MVKRYQMLYKFLITFSQEVNSCINRYLGNGNV